MNQEAEKLINEFLEKAKTQEDVEKLDLKDLDGCSGGSDTVSINGVEVSPAEFNNMFLAMAESCGFDVARDIFRTCCGGFKCREMETYYSWGGQYSDRDKMGTVLYRYWQYIETGKVY